MKKKKSNERLNQTLRAVLAATLKAFSLRLRITDSFDGRPVATFQPGEYDHIEHELSTKQEAFQRRVKCFWDPEENRRVELLRTRGLQGPLMKNEVFPALIQARLSIVHPACASAGYGEEGSQDIVEGFGGQSADIIDGLMLKLLKRSKGTFKSRVNLKNEERRETFIKDRMGDWHESPRMLALIDIVQSRLGKRCVDKQDGSLPSDPEAPSSSTQLGDQGLSKHSPEDRSSIIGAINMPYSKEKAIIFSEGF